MCDCRTAIDPEVLAPAVDDDLGNNPVVSNLSVVRTSAGRVSVSVDVEDERRSVEQILLHNLHGEGYNPPTPVIDGNFPNGRYVQTINVLETSPADTRWGRRSGSYVLEPAVVTVTETPGNARCAPFIAACVLCAFYGCEPTTDGVSDAGAWWTTRSAGDRTFGRASITPEVASARERLRQRRSRRVLVLRLRGVRPTTYQTRLAARHLPSRPRTHRVIAWASRASRASPEIQAPRRGGSSGRGAWTPSTSPTRFARSVSSFAPWASAPRASTRCCSTTAAPRSRTCRSCCGAPSSPATEARCRAAPSGCCRSSGSSAGARACSSTPSTSRRARESSAPPQTARRGRACPSRTSTRSIPTATAPPPRVVQHPSATTANQRLFSSWLGQDITGDGDVDDTNTVLGAVPGDRRPQTGYSPLWAVSQVQLPLGSPLRFIDAYRDQMRPTSVHVSCAPSSRAEGRGAHTAPAAGHGSHALLQLPCRSPSVVDLRRTHKSTTYAPPPHQAEVSSCRARPPARRAASSPWTTASSARLRARRR